MCEHCRSVGQNRKKIENDDRAVRVLCEAAVRRGAENAIKLGGPGCCKDWRQNCCGGGCCSDVANSGGSGSSDSDLGYKNGSMAMNHSTGRADLRINGPTARPRMTKEETELCETIKYKYCSGGECRSNNSAQDGEAKGED